jgi:hypothetical protein
VLDTLLRCHGRRGHHRPDADVHAACPVSRRLETAGGRAASDYFILACVDRSFWTPLSRRAPGSDTDGRFSVARAGRRYFIAALTDVEPGEWNDLPSSPRSCPLL